MSQIFTIIRIEHADGWGMFRMAGFPENERYILGDSPETCSMYELHKNRRTPSQDGIEISCDMFCAFESLDQFNELIIADELRWLLNNQPYKVLMLDVTNIAKGQHQVCFKKSDIIQSKDISSLFN